MVQRCVFLRFVLVFVAFFISAGVHAIPITPGIVNPANGHTYYLLEMTNWQAAEAEAVSMGGHLVTINDAAEQTWVFNTFSPLLPTPRSFWIGLNDLAVEGVFEWISGEPVTYLNWNAGEPRDAWRGLEDYVTMYGPSSPSAGYWNDTLLVSGNGIGEYGIVEIARTIPVPATVALMIPGLLGLRLVGRRVRPGFPGRCA